MRRINPNARRLRRDMTDSERKLWSVIRNRQLAGAKSRRQWTLGPYIADFCCVEARLVVEVDGGQHCDDADLCRTKAIEKMGYRVIRFWNHDVLRNVEGVAAVIVAALIPHPDPLPHAGEGG
jgi:very-short-patch-repair endonuclease